MVLQCLFAQMQSSKAPYIDAKPLIEMLDLRPHIQQDSLEFSKLLGSYLEAVLSASQSQSGGVSSSSDHPSSSSLLKKFSEEYKGIFQYTIECCRCHTKTFREAEFAELEVSIPVCFTSLLLQKLVKARITLLFLIIYSQMEDP